jgi:hypothetical protein
MTHLLLLLLINCNILIMKKLLFFHPWVFLQCNKYFLAIIGHYISILYNHYVFFEVKIFEFQYKFSTFAVQNLKNY